MEGGLFQDAIFHLSEAITLNPELKEAYFDRAVAYFETGDFDKSIEDYLHSKKRMSPDSYTTIPSFDIFVRGFAKGLYEGSSNSAKEFIPSMLNTVYGVGCTLWAACEHPLESASVAWDNVYAFAEASWDMTVSTVEFCKTLDKEKINEIYLQLSEKTICLLEQFENLPMEERGLLIGTIIGECGTDYFIATTTCGAGSYAKYARGAEKLKNVNRLCNLQKISNSPHASTQVKTAALTQKLARDNYLKTIKVNWGDQNKHIPGTHQYINEVKMKRNKGTLALNRDEITAGVVDFAGRGQRVTLNKEPFTPGYRERVDFGKVIGTYINEEGTITQETTMAMFHHSKDGIHIIPARPKGLISE